MSDPALATIQRFIDEQNIDKSQPHWRQDLEKPPQAEFDSTRRYVWTVKTNKGSMDFRLLPDVAPMHVSSTLYLTLLGFYDGIRFHRVIDGFMAQGGCPRGDGTGGPGYEYDGEFSPQVRHDRPGLLSMANAGPHTDGSQFFITFVPTPHLDGKHTIFGELIAGDDTLRALEAKGSRSGRTGDDLVIESCSVRVVEA